VDERENFDGDTVALFQEDHAVYIPNAQERLQDGALPQDGAYSEWLMLAETTVNRTLSDNILVKAVIQGAAVDWKLYAQDIRQMNYDDTNYDVADSAAGQYFFDFTDGGLLRGAVAASGLLTQYQVLNPGGANLDDLLIYTRRVFLPVNYAPASGPKAAKNS
jgi:hypothetical protein